MTKIDLDKALEKNETVYLDKAGRALIDPEEYKTIWKAAKAWDELVKGIPEDIFENPEQYPDNTINLAYFCAAQSWRDG